MNWKKWAIVASVIIFIVANLYLIFKKDSKIARSEYINEWTSIKEQNLVLSKKKEGVIAPLEEEYVYLKSGIGDFEQFLVKEGEEVQVGSSLFEYSPRNMEEAIKQFEAEITKLENERDAIEDAIDSLKKIEKSLSASSSEENNHEAAASSIEAQIAEKKLQLSRIEAEINKYEELVANSDESMGSLTVESGISGVVKKISHDLQNPVVTITSDEKHIKGILEEEELQEIEEGMKVIIASKSSLKKLEGIISNISVNPEQDPHVDKSSQFEFTVDFVETSEEEDEGVEEQLEEEKTLEIFTGAHVDMKIITKEVEDALTIPESAIRKGYMYVLKGNGTIEKRPTETGIKVNNTYEITSEAEKGELIVNNPSIMKTNSSFFTPIELGKMKKNDFKDMGKKELLKYIGKGFLSR